MSSIEKAYKMLINQHQTFDMSKGSFGNGIGSRAFASSFHNAKRLPT